MRCSVATRSTIWASTGSRSRSSTTTSPAMRSSRANCRTPCRSARISTARAISTGARAGACDYVMPDLMRIGGVTGWLRAAASRRRGHSDVDPSLSGDRRAPHAGHPEPRIGSSGRTGPSDFGRAVPGSRTVHIQIPDRPGNGLMWGLSAVRRYLPRRLEEAIAMAPRLFAVRRDVLLSIGFEEAPGFAPDHQAPRFSGVR